MNFGKRLDMKRALGGVGQGQCEDWVRDVLGKPEIAQLFHEEIAELGDIQIDQYATSVLRHCWLSINNGTGFVADVTAGQYESSYMEGYYGLLNEAPDL